MFVSMKRGQGATELLIVLGVGLVVLVMILVFSSDSLNSYKAQFRENQAENALESLESAVSLLYQQGEGAQTQVFLTMPAVVNNTIISGKTMSIIFLNGNTIYRSLDINVSGNLPNNTGGHYVDLKSQTGVVYISTNLTEVLPTEEIVCGDNVCNYMNGGYLL